MSTRYDVPRLGEPFLPRGLRGVAIVLDEFAPTHLDTWLGRAVLDPAAVRDGAPGEDLAVRVLVVRQAGDVASRGLAWGRRGARLRAVRDARPPERPLLGVVVEAAGATALWLPEEDPSRLAVALSRREWRDHTDLG